MATVTVTATVEPDNVPPRVRLNVSSSDATSAVITRLDSNGRTVPVRTANGGPVSIVSGVALLYDYEAPYGEPVQYSSQESPGVTSTRVTLDADSVWLIHPGVPVLSMPIRVGAFGERSYAAQQGVFQPLGRSTPVVVTDGSRKAAGYDLTLVTLTSAERANLSALLSDAATLLLNVPTTKAFGIGAEYIAVGDVKEGRVTRIAAEAARSWSLSCSVVARPAGGSQAQRTYSDVIADNATYTTVMSRYGNYFSLLAGP
jgi:hypothetical protein